jgi:hypothetical protein
VGAVALQGFLEGNEPHMRLDAAIHQRNNPAYTLAQAHALTRRRSPSHLLPMVTPSRPAPGDYPCDKVSKSFSMACSSTAAESGFTP